ncbi:hypothetical protein O1611_g4404 [Lasiodiplodia mahajangana]|uniref:Uncharacterized protein n=1 Tax=Lasiodiplodia mahajangana TaxID=1108764 RepID=A0ACC2JP00_9PEZI|nr:hypothetical protein O1611_g4404 [Lasiodiplodia mahajangana]
MSRTTAPAPGIKPYTEIPLTLSAPPSLVVMALSPREDVFLQDDPGPTLIEHALQCSNFFQKYLAMPEIVSDSTLIDGQLARFTLRESNMDVFSPPNVSLDYRLSLIQVTIIVKPCDSPSQILSSKRQRISQNGHIKTPRNINDNSGDSDSNKDQARKNVSIITYTICGTITRLFRLHNAIRQSAKASRANKIREYSSKKADNAIAELRLYTECYIRFQFPKEPKALRSTLVLAHTLQLRRLYYQTSHRKRVTLSVQRPQATPTPVQLPKLPENTRTIPPAPLTHATTARQTAVRALYANSVEVPRAKSDLVNNKLSFPPIPTTDAHTVELSLSSKGPKSP